MADKNRFEISYDIRKKIYNFCLQEFSKRADEIIDVVEDCYLDSVNRFYSEKVFRNKNGKGFTNIPRYYKRHPYSSIEDSGMAQTYQRYKDIKWHGNQAILTVGIILNTYRMYDGYNSKDKALYSFTQGYHGLPIQNIRGNVRPIVQTKQMAFKKIKKDLINPIDTRNLKL